MSAPRQTGALLVVGGSEDREGTKEVLQRFVDLAGGPDKPLVVLTAASEVPDDVWAIYQKAFHDLQARNVRHIRTNSRADADKSERADAVRNAAGIFLTGGSQTRLFQTLGDSAIARAMHQAYENGACVAGTSAGASAVCTRMLMNGKAELLPEKDAIRLGPGLGFIDGVIVDQHFSQRHRINRLLSVTAEHPSEFGIGIDEDTALLIKPEEGIEVVGDGSVNIVDCRQASTNIRQVSSGATPIMLGVRLHVLPAHTAFRLDGATAGDALPADAAPVPPELIDFITNLTNRNQSA